MRNLTTDDPADLFLAVYDEIGDEPFDDQAVVTWRRRDRWVQWHSANLCDQVVNTGRVPAELADRLLADGARGMFTVLKGLDEALTHADVRFSTPSDTREMYEWAFRHFTRGYLNSDPRDGLLLYRLVDPPRPTGLPARASDFGLVRVPPEVIRVYNVDYERLPPQLDLSWPLPLQDAGERISVGCVAMVGGYDELTIRVRGEHGLRRYRLSPRTEPLKARIRAIIRALDDSGAQIGILPEAALSDPLLAAWKKALREDPPSLDCDLRWILVGTGPVGESEPPFNRGVLLLRDEGQEILTYDKHFDFTLSPAQVETWNLKPYIGEGSACEDIHRGNRVLVRESLLGRLGILICEDLTRLTEAGAALAHFGVSHLFVPIFSPPITQETWDATTARMLVGQIGASIVVVNSLAIGRATEPSAPLGTCCAVIPPEGPSDEWRRMEVNVRTASRPEDVALLEVPAPVLKRFTR